MLICGDCVEEMKKIKSNTVDSVVSDPPYNIGFMSKEWDKTGIVNDINMWKEVYRILKPGGHMLIFNSTRTYHRMVCAIEDAGFEIRDTLSWIYGSGMPHGTDIAKQIESKIKTGSSNTQAFKKLKGEIAKSSMGYNTIHANNDRPNNYNGNNYIKNVEFQAEKAKKWCGWNTCLKPAQELICLARKPLEEKTVGENVLKYGTGGLNIDAGRIKTDEIITNHGHGENSGNGNGIWGKFSKIDKQQSEGQKSGRFPTNVILDEEASQILDMQSGNLKSGTNCVRTKEGTFFEHKGLGKIGDVQKTYGDEGGASRFFYCAKASKSEKGKYNDHITVKPLKLMEYLVTLITPMNGIVLDMFMGSGTTGIACKHKNFDFIGIEKDSHYFDVAKLRIDDNKNKS